MKRLLSWFAGFFDSDSSVSSKRLVGISGAGFLYYTLYTNSKSAAGVEPSETLVWGTVVLVCTSLGLASVKEISDLVNSMKGGKKEESNTDANNQSV